MITNISWPKTIPAWIVICSLGTAFASTATGVWTVAKLDSAYDEKVKAAKDKITQMESGFTSIQLEIEKMKRDLEELKVSDKVRGAVTDRMEETMRRIENKLDDLRERKPQP